MPKKTKTKAKPAPKPKAKAKAKAKVKPAPKPKAKAKAKVKPAPKPKAKPKAKAKAKAKPAPKPKAKAKAKAKAKPAPKPKAKAKPAPKTKPKPKAKAKTAPKAKAKPAPKPKVKTKPVSKPKTKAAPKAAPKAKTEPKAKATPKPKPTPYSKGDYAVYPTHGVGKITAIEKQTIVGQELRVVVINFPNEKMTLSVPLEKAEASGLRKLSSRDKMRGAMKILRGKARIRRTMWSRRAQEYELKINSGDPISIAEVVRDLYRNAGQPDQSYSERQIYELAFERLCREVAAVENINDEKAMQKIEGHLQAEQPKAPPPDPSTPG